LKISVPQVTPATGEKRRNIFSLAGLGTPMGGVLRQARGLNIFSPGRPWPPRGGTLACYGENIFSLGRLLGRLGVPKFSKINLVSDERGPPETPRKVIKMKEKKFHFYDFSRRFSPSSFI
jgi:hypothetical protein